MLDASSPESATDARLLRAGDVVLALVLMAAGLAGRLWWVSGIGLGDDFIFRGEVATILYNHTVLPDNQAYRFLWWLPTALSCRILGLTEVGLILPFTATATLGIGLVYLLGKTLWGRAGGVIAALLLIVTPLDFAWSTMMVPDLMLSVAVGFAMLFTLRAFAVSDPLRRRRAWVYAAIALWLSFHAKIPGVLIAPALAMVALARWRDLDRHVLGFVVTATVLFGGSVLVFYVLTGDPIAPYTMELRFQGLSGPQATARKVYPALFWYFPELLVKPDHLGNLLFSIYPYLIAAFVLAWPVLRLRMTWPAFWWFLFFFLGLQMNFQHVDGVWIAGFRNVRHLHVLVYPVVLMLAGYLVGLRSRFPKAHAVLFVAILAMSGWQSVSAAHAPHEAFAERRRACRYLMTLPSDVPIHSGQGLQMWCTVLDPKNGRPRLTHLHSSSSVRRSQIAAIASGYLVTGAANDPIYGCPPCIPRREELEPGRWRLVKEFPAPEEITEWRFEPVRVWERVRDGGVGAEAAAPR